MRGKVKKYIWLYFIMLFMFLILKLIAYSLPTEPVRNHVVESNIMMQEEGLYPQLGYITSDKRIYQRIDGYTDAIYLNVAYRIDNRNIFEMIAADYRGGAGKNPLEQLDDTILHPQENETSYSRQWFGAMVYIRPLLLFFNLAEIRYIFQLLFLVLFFYTTFQLYKNIDEKIAYAYCIAFFFVSPFVIPFSFNVVNVFFVIFLLIILICKTNLKISDYGIYIFVTGGLTAFLDLFLTPFITFGVISIILLYIDFKRNVICDLSIGLFKMIKYAILWLVGYMGLWVSKWLYATIILHQNVLKLVWLEMAHISGGSVSWGPDSKMGYIIESLQLNFSKLFPNNIYLILHDEYPIKMTISLFICILILGYIWWKHKKSWREMYFGVTMLCMAVSPYIYYIIMHFHTYVHFWVEFRYQMITIMGVILAYLTTTNFKHKRKKFKDK